MILFDQYSFLDKSNLKSYYHVKDRVFSVSYLTTLLFIISNCS